MTNQTEQKIEVGTLATTGCGSDCYPAIVTKVSPSGKTIEIKNVDFIIAVEGLAIGGPNAQRASANRGEIILGWPEEDAPAKVYTLRKNGRFYTKGQKSLRYGSLSLGDALAYQDPHF